MITTRIGRVGALASKSRVLLGARSMATISDSPLDKKIEMCIHEKVRFPWQLLASGTFGIAEHVRPG
ncbi:hypothetical protein EMCG_08090 [[Emmonsia] crescens]|uniref:Uncharacterized protein n=1 Tax=[Emmonsia] crescens TaxID=73230 RepID=A0A0G2I6D9_9EURO|nr:hypothetical protein EMCG_08090 [Emmonsia crescens UAMH 3008]